MHRSIRAVAGSLLLAIMFCAAAAADDPLAKLFGGPFELVDHNGKPRTDKAFRGRFLLAAADLVGLRARVFEDFAIGGEPTGTGRAPRASRSQRRSAGSCRR